MMVNGRMGNERENLATFSSILMVILLSIKDLSRMINLMVRGL
jgi:hypothetical protein